ncbi:MAG: CRISPR-associated endonuclease Cas1 [Terriglobia bacterium]|nr:CRISPR-associated endonuclease Cas1 [Terriglobia bacterium]
MDRGNSADIPANDLDWQDRSEFWRTYSPPGKYPGQRKKYRHREPLILCGHGLKIRVDHDTLLIRNGVTHYPQTAEEFRFYPGDPNIPDRIIILDGSGGITLDALNWMAEQEINFIQLDYRGRVSFICGNSGQAPKTEILRWQLEIQGTKIAREIQRQLVEQKLLASIVTLEAIFPNFQSTEIAINQIQREIGKIRKLPNSAAYRTILGLEGLAAAAYFKAWHAAPLKWANLKKRPIPPSWQEIGSRNMNWKKDGANARHPVNAMLNYGYAVLNSQIAIEVAAAGFDLSIGIAHSGRRNSKALVYDFMEPMRPLVDRKILEFALAHTFAPGDLTINKWGGCRLNPQMAKVVASRITDIGEDRFVKAFLKVLS